MTEKIDWDDPVETHYVLMWIFYLISLMCSAQFFVGDNELHLTAALMFLIPAVGFHVASRRALKRREKDGDAA